MIDKPLYQNPLAGGQQAGGPGFRQEGDMGRYVAFNDPGQPGAGYSNLQDYLAAGNKLPEQKTPNDLLGVSKPDTSGPQLLNPLEDPFSNITAPQQIPDRYRQGYEDFYNQNPNDYQRIGGAAVSYVTTPQGETIRFGDTGGASNFRRYLESIGETPGTNENFLSTNLLEVAGSPEMGSASPPASPGFTPLPPSNNFIDDMRDKTLPTLQFPEGTGPLQTVQGPKDTLNPYNRVGQQLMGPNQDDILGTLKNIEQGIASLGQGSMNQSSFGGFNNNFGIGSFFPPYGGMYG